MTKYHSGPWRLMKGEQAAYSGMSTKPIGPTEQQNTNQNLLELKARMTNENNRTLMGMYRYLRQTTTCWSCVIYSRLGGSGKGVGEAHCRRCDSLDVRPSGFVLWVSRVEIWRSQKRNIKWKISRSMCVNLGHSDLTCHPSLNPSGPVPTHFRNRV